MGLLTCAMKSGLEVDINDARLIQTKAVVWGDNGLVLVSMLFSGQRKVTLDGCGLFRYFEQDEQFVIIWWKMIRGAGSMGKKRILQSL